MNKKIQKLIDELNEVEKNDHTRFKEVYTERLRKLTTNEVEMLFSVIRENKDAYHHTYEWKGASEF